MKCPMQTVQKRFDATHAEIDFFQCIKDECAWWDKESKKCAILSIAYRLNNINQGIKK